MFEVPKRIVFNNPEEVLTHKVNGKKASDMEERFARAVYKLGDWQYEFRYRISPLSHRVSEVIRNLPGELEIDFICVRGGTVVPVLVQGEIGHFYAAWQQAFDEAKEAAINEAMRAYHAAPVIKVPENKHDLYKLSTQAFADKTVRDVLSQY
jgi:hypothetical protein